MNALTGGNPRVQNKTIRIFWRVAAMLSLLAMPELNPVKAHGTADSVVQITAARPL